MTRGLRRGAVLGGILLLAAALTAPASAAGTSSGNSPCDSGFDPLQLCTSALGPLIDVSAHWQDYQPALTQPVPISDYFPGDPEDTDPPLGAGHCGTETTPAPPPTIPKGVILSSLPLTYPVPPGKLAHPRNSAYCLLTYVPSDFDSLCTGCHRIFIDFSAIPVGSTLAPGADGHWAGRMTAGTNLGATIPFDAHSPNIKNLCSDKFFNPSQGSDCVILKSFDQPGAEMEGDTSVFHHYPLEGRYYNGPAYLAGDGATAPYHWVHGAYFDLDPGAGVRGGSIWYGAGYRGATFNGATNPQPDTDQSYGCLCEVPPIGATSYSGSYPLDPNVNPRPVPPTVNSGGPANPGTHLPNTAAASPTRWWPVSLVLGGLALLVAGRLAYRGR